LAIRLSPGILECDGPSRRCFVNLLFLGTLALLTVACGGGGGSSGPVASTSACIAAEGGSAGGSNTATLTWDAVTHANLCGYRVYYVATSLPTEYRVERCQGVSCNNFVEVHKLAGTTYSDKSIVANTSYSYRVRAADAAGSLSEYSVVASDTSLTVPPAPGLVAAYAFNEGAGATVTDASGNNNTGTISGAVWVPSGVPSGGGVDFGMALEFNGTNSQVTVPHSASLDLTTAMTLEAWLSPVSALPDEWRVVVAKDDAGYFLYATTDPQNSPAGGGFLSGGASIITQAPAELTVGEWTHLAVTFDGATVRLYVNGNQVASQANPPTSFLPTNSTLHIGGLGGGVGFAGLIDEVRIYNKALIMTEIKADMTKPISPDVSPPTRPAALTAIGATALQINLAWSASTDNVSVSSYQVERCLGAACVKFVEVATATGTTYVDTTSLLPETTYRYQVRAVDAAGNLSTPSNIANASTLASGTILPTAPGGLTAVAASTTAQIDLSWGLSTTAPAVYIQSVGQGINAGNSSTYTVTGLSSGARYFFAVTALDTSNNESTFSNVVYKEFP